MTLSLKVCEHLGGMTLKCLRALRDSFSFFFFLAALGLRAACSFSSCRLSCGMWDFSSPTMDWTWTPCIGSVESQPLDH